MYFELLHDCKVNRIDTTLLYALDCVKNSNLEDTQYDKETIFEMATLVNNVWLKSDVDLSISRIADVIVENWEEIKKEDMSTSDILNEYYDTLEEGRL